MPSYHYTQQKLTLPCKLTHGQHSQPHVEAQHSDINSSTQIIWLMDVIETECERVAVSERERKCELAGMQANARYLLGVP